MDVYRYPSTPVPYGRYAATIGFFDGVHLGHRYLLQQLRSKAAAVGMKAMAVTFDRHPRQMVQTGWQPQLLTTLDEKIALLSQAGIDAVVVLGFDSDMAALPARQFMSDVLRDRLHAEVLLTGYDNRFGHNRTDTFADYVRYGRELGMEVLCADPLAPPSVGAFSSSMVRRLLADGCVAEAARCLGRNYSISGRVVQGEHNGHGLGFPTANLKAGDAQKLIPANGAYAVQAVLADGTRHRAMTNIGTRPTFHGQGLTLETNIFDSVGNLYGQQLTIEFVARLRDEQPFQSPEALANQLAADRQKAEQLLPDALQSGA